MQPSELYGMGLPVDLSAYGGNIDRLINVIHLFSFVLLVGWGIFMIYCLVTFRAGTGKAASYDGIKAGWSKYMEVLVVLVEIFFLVGLSMPVWSNLKGNIPDKSAEDVLRVRVIAQQFAWNVHYPGADGIFGRTDIHLIDEALNAIGLDEEDQNAKDDIVLLNHLYIPEGKDIVVYLSSKDVIHSFFLPILRTKQDAIPGMEFPVWFKAELPEGLETVDSEIACAQLCGLNHYSMRGFLHIYTEEGFEEWHANEEPFFTEFEGDFDDF